MNFKKLLTFLVINFALVQLASAQAYFIQNASNKFDEDGEAKVYTFDATPAILTISMSKGGTYNYTKTTDFYIEESSNNSNWTTIKKFSRDFDQSSKNYNLKSDTRYLRLRYVRKGWNNATCTATYSVTKMIDVNPSQLTFDETEIGVAVKEKFNVLFSRAGTLSLQSSDNDVFSPSLTTISESTSTNNGSKEIEVTFNPTDAGTFTGSITVGNGTQSKIINLSATATKKAQTITWADNSSIIPLGEELANAATASSGGAVAYTSDNSDIIRVENGKLVGVAEGIATITASQAGDDTWAAVSDSKNIEVTQKEIQTITWTQDLYKLRVGDAPVTLDATTDSNLPITYTSSDTDVVSVSGNTLTIVGAGETNITATQAGDATWAAAAPVVLPVRVRVVSDACDEHVIYDFNSHELMNGWSSGSSKEYTLSKPADKLNYEVWFGGVSLGSITVKEYYANGESKELKSSGKGKVSNLQVSRYATKLKFSASGTASKGIKNITLTQATYLETDATAVNFGDIPVGTVANKTLKVLYSNLPDIVEVSNENADFSLSENLSFGSKCGDHGTQNIVISITPDTQGEIHDTITVVSNNKKLLVPVVANVVRKTQSIAWEQDFSSTLITDTVTLTASSSSHLPIAYTSSNTEVATVVDGKLSFIKSGTVQITAAQAGNDEFRSAQDMTKSVTVSKITPTIATAPTASNITYGQTLADAVLSNGVASAAGTFAWTNAATIPNAGDAQEFEVTFTPENLNYFVTNTVNVAVNVAKAAQSITWEQDLSVLKINEELDLSASSSAGLDVAFTSSNTDVAVITEGKLSFVTSGTVTITASQAGDDNHLAATSVEKTLTINKLTPTITTAPTAADISYGQTLADAVLSNGEASVAGTFAWASPSAKPNVGLAQNYQAIFTPENANHYNMAPVVVAVNVAKAAQTITWEQDFADIRIDEVITLLASVDSRLPITFTSSDPTVATVENGALTVLKEGSTTITASQAGNENYLAATSVEKTITVSKVATNIAIPPTASNITYGQTLADAVLSNGVASVDGTFAWADNTIEPNAGTQTYQVVFTPTDAHIYSPTTVDVAVNVAKATQTITWDQDLSAMTIIDELDLNASVNSDLALTLSSSNTEVAVITDGKLTFVAAGTADITASQAGDDNHLAATSVVKSISVSKLIPTVTTMPTASDITYGQTLADATLNNGVASVAGTFAWADAITPNAGNAQTFQVKFTPSAINHYEEVTFDVAVNVAKATQSITWNDDLSAVQITDEIDLSATASSGLDVLFTSSNTDVAIITDGKLTFLSAGTADITASQAGNENYLAATDVVKSITLGVATPTITAEPTASNITYGETLANSILSNGAASVAGTFAWVDNTIEPNAGDNQTFEVIFTPDATATYSTVTFDVAVNVAKAAQSITWNDDLSAVQITDEIDLNATASSGLDVEFTSSNTDVAIITDGKLTFLSAGTADITASQAGGENYLAATDVVKSVTIIAAAPTITVEPTATNITYGETLANSILSNGAASVAGTFAWVDNTIEPNAGDNQTFEVIFTPDATDTYSTVTFDVAVNVAKATQSITWEQDLNNLEINDEFTLAATASSGLDVAFTSSDTTVAVIENGVLKILAYGTSSITASQAGNDNYLAATDDVTVLVIVSTTTSANATVRKFSVYPNPATDYLMMNTLNDELITVYDQGGKMIMQQQASEGISKLDVSGLVPGKYVVKLISNNNKGQISTVFIKR